MNQSFPGEWWLRESCKILGVSKEETEKAVERGRVEMEKFKEECGITIPPKKLPPLPSFMTIMEEGMKVAWENSPVNPSRHVSKEEGDE